ncbi:MAG TPA: redoxin domain-containing protein [Terriglobia bacterium]|nr:redoxin domain-containing protein [Terriglobia bacterium]
MRRTFGLAIVVALLAIPVLAQLQAPGPDNSIKVGEMAPDFAIPAAQRGQPAGSLKDFQGKKNVLIMFFPAAFSPGCTTEFTQAGIHYDKFTALDIEMIGISRDQPFALNAFKTSVGAKNAFVSDLEYVIAPKYGASTPNRGMLRYYFLIDKTGKIVWKDTSNRVLETEKMAGDLAQALKSGN